MKFRNNQLFKNGIALKARIFQIYTNTSVCFPDKNNVIDLYLSDYDSQDVLGEDVWRKYFAVKPDPFTRAEKDAYLSGLSGVVLASDAFFPFSDNIEKAVKSGVSYVCEPGGSVRDDLVIDSADKHNMVMCFTGMRLFHH